MQAADQHADVLSDLHAIWRLDSNRCWLQVSDVASVRIIDIVVVSISPCLSSSPPCGEGALDPAVAALSTAVLLPG
jgi:hypothetical protein